MVPGQQHGAREAILGKIRRALKIPAPYPGKHTAASPHAPGINGNGATGKGLQGAVSEGQQPGLQVLSPPVQPGSSLRAGEAQGTVRAEVVDDVTGGRQVLQSLPVMGGGAEWRQFLPPPGESWDKWVQLFAVNSEGLKTEFHLLSSLEELPGALAQLAADCDWKTVALQNHPLVKSAVSQLNLPQVVTDDGGYDRDELAACQVGITACDALIAQTGTVLLGCKTSGGRAISVLPPHHVVVARKDQLLPDLPAAFALLQESYGQAWPSSITLVTGPSRTGDIERILVLGAHGPKRLTIFLV